LKLIWIDEMTYMDHDRDYPPQYLAAILKSVKTIAMVGASPDPTKFSYGVLRVLSETGYDLIPVNPKEAGSEIRGLKVYESLAQIDRPIDMVEVFRSSDALLGVTREAIDINAKVIWSQIGVRDDKAARLAEDAGIKVVMNRCPKIELFRPFWKPRLGQQI
jgi:predicted CoA-binding protein